MVKILKIILLSVFILGAGFFALISVGRFFIREITQDIKIESAPKAVFAEVGKPAPYFELFDIGGKKITPADFLGQGVILTFWTTWNNTSADELRIFDEYSAKYSEKPFVILAVNSQEDKSAVMNFINRGGYKSRVLLDENGELTERYHARNLPVTYFISVDGLIRHIVTGVISADMLADTAETMRVK